MRPVWVGCRECRRFRAAARFRAGPRIAGAGAAGRARGLRSWPGGEPGLRAGAPLTDCQDRPGLPRGAAWVLTASPARRCCQSADFNDIAGPAMLP